MTILVLKYGILFFCGPVMMGDSLDFTLRPDVDYQDARRSEVV